MKRRLLLALVSLLSLAQTRAALQPDAPATCCRLRRMESAARTVPRVRQYLLRWDGRALGRAGHVRTRALILLDGGLPQSAPLIDANIRALGFRTEDVRVDRQLARALRSRGRHRGDPARERRHGRRKCGRRSRARTRRADRPTIRSSDLAVPPTPSPRSKGARRRRRRGRARRATSAVTRAFHAGSHAGQHDLDVAVLRGSRAA